MYLRGGRFLGDCADIAELEERGQLRAILEEENVFHHSQDDGSSEYEQQDDDHKHYTYVAPAAEDEPSAGLLSRPPAPSERGMNAHMPTMFAAAKGRGGGKGNRGRGGGGQRKQNKGKDGQQRQQRGQKQVSEFFQMSF